MSTESHPDVPLGTCQGEKSYLEMLLRPDPPHPAFTAVLALMAVLLLFTKVKLLQSSRLTTHPGKARKDASRADTLLNLVPEH